MRKRKKKTNKQNQTILLIIQKLEECHYRVGKGKRNNWDLTGKPCRFTYWSKNKYESSSPTTKPTKKKKKKDEGPIEK